MNHIGRVDGDEVHEAVQAYLEKHPNIGLPYGGTIGFWNAFISRMHQIGFEFKRVAKYLPPRTIEVREE